VPSTEETVQKGAHGEEEDAQAQAPLPRIREEQQRGGHEKAGRERWTQWRNGAAEMRPRGEKARSRRLEADHPEEHVQEGDLGEEHAQGAGRGEEPALEGQQRVGGRGGANVPGEPPGEARASPSLGPRTITRARDTRGGYKTRGAQTRAESTGALGCNRMDHHTHDH
jgi:hypothetical protein